jgi:DNA-binding IclR family transcriptional regulator
MSQTVTRAIAILRFIAASPRDLSEVAAHLGVHKTTALRLLQTLESEGLSRRTDSGMHALGFTLVSLGQDAMAQIDLRSIAHRHLEKLRNGLGHTVHFAQLVGRQIIYLDKIDGYGTVAMGSRIGRSADLHTSGVAKAILAFQPDAVIRGFAEEIDYHQFTSKTIKGAAEWVRELEATRLRGWAEDDGEKEDFINCVAVPVRDATGKVTLSLSVTALRAAAPLKQLRGCLPVIRETALAISHDIGGERAT